MDTRELANLPFPELLEEVRKDPESVKSSIPDNMQRLFAARVLSTLAANGKADPAMRNVLGTKPNQEYFSEVWSLLMKCIEGSSLTEPPARLPPAAPPAMMAVPTNPTPPSQPASPATLGDTPTTTRRRRAHSTPTTENGAPQTSVPAVELLTEEVRAFSQATTQQAASIAAIKEQVALLTAEVQDLRKGLDRMAQAVAGVLEELGRQIDLNSRIVLAASEMTGNARPQEILEAADLPYIKELVAPMVSDSSSG